MDNVKKHNSCDSLHVINGSKMNSRKMVILFDVLRTILFEHIFQDIMPYSLVGCY
jgi:hypothetical protein